MLLQNPFAAIATTGLDSGLLTVLSRVEHPLTIQEIMALMPGKGSAEGIRQSAARLREHGVVLETIAGRTKSYLLNREHLLAGPIIQISNAKVALIHRVQEMIASWDPEPLCVELFGSTARNEMRLESDIDILVVFADDTDEARIELLVSQLAASIYRWTGNDARPLVYTASEVSAAPIFDSIIREGINIGGDASWLRKHLRGERQKA